MPSTSQNDKHKLFGRTQKDFSNCSDKTKKRRIQEITDNVSSEQLIFAVKSSFMEQGKRAAADLLEKSILSPNRAVKMRRSLQTIETFKTVVPYTPEEALAFILNTGMTKDMYIRTRIGAMERNANIFPAYEKVKKAKIECIPEGVIVSDEG